MADQRSANVARLRAFASAHPDWVLFDEPSQMLYDVGLGKSLPLPLGELVEVVEKRNTQTARPYLLLTLGDGRELALADVGIAFPPLAPNVPQAPPMPPVVCLRDFHMLRGQLEHVLYGHPDEKPGRQALDMVALAIAILDGARLVGFDISREERQLEALLSELERR